ncbi:unnamed protein product [Boreogadus saida]
MSPRVVFSSPPSRHLNLVPDQPEGWSGMADTTITHQPATESINRTPISGMGDTWLDSQGKALKGTRAQTERADE